MIGSMSTPVSIHQGTEMTGPWKAVGSVGHRAKAAVAVAREAGADVPRNAQGLAASAIARGVDPASLFTARLTPTTEIFGGADIAPDAGAAEGEATTDEFGSTDTPDIIPVSEDPDAAMLVNYPEAVDDVADGNPIEKSLDLGAVVQPAATDLFGVLDGLRFN